MHVHVFSYGNFKLFHLFRLTNAILAQPKRSRNDYAEIILSYVFLILTTA